MVGDARELQPAADCVKRRSEVAEAVASLSAALTLSE